MAEKKLQISLSLQQCATSLLWTDKEEVHKDRQATLEEEDTLS